MRVIQKKKGSKKYFYLQHSIRKGKRVITREAYLGKEIPKNIEEMKEKLLKEAKKELYKKLERIQENFQKEWKRTPETARQKEKEEIAVAFTYNTNAIEGSTITQEEVFDILEKNKWPFSRPKEDISEAYGVSKAIKHIRKIKTHLSLKLMQDIHKIVFENSKTFAGKFRAKGVEVGIRDGTGNIIHLGAPANRVVPLLTELVKWYKKNKSKLPAIVLAVVVHNQFEYIHPFEDGNGRVGRLLLNNILLKHKLPPLSISLKNRKQYYETLRVFQRTGDIKPSIELALKEYKLLRKKLKKN